MRFLIRALLALVVVVVVGVLALMYWPADWSLNRTRASSESPVSTSGSVDSERVRERAAEIGEKAADATKHVQETVAEAALTTKIKAKIALDDSVKARNINVTTEGSTVTVSGKVPSAAAHERALALARETEGVSVVIDHLDIVPGSEP